VRAAEVLEVMADRTATEQTFKDVKEVWGAGQQQVHNVFAHLRAMAINLISVFAVCSSGARGSSTHFQGARTIAERTSRPEARFSLLKHRVLPN
jgi:hypothetical protein